MAGRTPHEAVEAFVEPLQLAISCVTKAVLVHPRPQEEEAQALTLNNGEPAALQGKTQLGLKVVQQYRVVEAEGELGPLKVRTGSYSYELVLADSTKLFAYHWHSEAKIEFPHIHIYAPVEKGQLRKLLSKAHLPTGRVSLEEVLRLAIRDLGVRPLREDWDAVLGKTQRGFEEW